MNIPEIQQKLIENHRRFTDYMESLPDDVFGIPKNGKWSPGQHLDHIRRSVQPLAQGFGFPKWLIKIIFGKSNRSGKNSDELVKKYKRKLEEGGRASGRFIPKALEITEKNKIIDSLNKDILIITKNLSAFSEKELDEIVLPHPLLGKLTIREMMFFTIYHVEHHMNLTKKYY
jgi:DinB superfamily